jgi:hypothetical protein
MGKLTLVVLLLLATCFQPTCSFMGSMLGGSITWRLHPEVSITILFFNVFSLLCVISHPKGT